jgi:hypothetical protein
MVIFPPALSENRQWNEMSTQFKVKEHSVDEVVAALGGANVVA